MRLSKLVTLCVLFASYANLQGAEPALPDLEIQLTSKFSNTTEIPNNYFAILSRQVLTSFNSLHAMPLKSDGKSPPKDGTAQYRLVVEHVGNVVVGNQITTERVTQDGIGGGGWTRYFYIEVQQTGSLSLKLIKWEAEEKKYKEIQKWSAPIPVSEREQAAKGRIEVGKVMGGFQKNDDAKPSISLLDAQKAAILAVQPGNIRDILLGKFVTIKANKTTAKALDAQKGGGFEVQSELTIKNNSPWSIKRLQVTATYTGGVFFPGTSAIEMQGPAPWVEFQQPVAAGEEVTVSVIGRDRKDQKSGIQGIEFLATQP